MVDRDLDVEFTYMETCRRNLLLPSLFIM